MASNYLTTPNARPGPQIRATGSCTCPQNLSECDLQLGSHEYTGLVQKITEYAQRRRALCHPRQTKAYSEWLECRENFWLDSKNPSIHNLRNWARIFDDCFFWGTLHDKCLLDWSPGLMKGGAYGTTQEISMCAEHQQIHKVEILIEPCPCEDVNHSCPLILNTLLHELCHSALVLFGYKEKLDARTHLMYFGLTGHGDLFFDLFRTISHRGKNKFQINLEVAKIFPISRILERHAREDALEKFGATLSDIPRVDLAVLERALARRPDSGLGVFWTFSELSSVRSMRSFCWERSQVDTRRIRNFQVVEE